MFDEQRPKEFELAPDLAALEAKLRGLTPATPQIDRDRLMFAAGRAGVSRRTWPGYIAGPSWSGRWYWPAATATMAAAMLLLATMLVWQNSSPPPNAGNLGLASNAKTGPFPTDVAPSAVDSALPPTLIWNSAPSSTSGYLAMRYIALTQGVGALPDPSASSGGRDSSADSESAKPATARNLLDELLPSITRSAQSRS
ncbi:MAG TPA: hypothetical protein VHE81_11155 [Lacipirellulaceae bacterium]|nr:hypothetical protein [Lacipirellulaceae bacterium]